jgi:hypothetical protein
MSRRLLTLLLLACALPLRPVAAPPGATTTEDWGLLAGLMFSEAETAFATAAATGDRWARLGHAAALLNHPPVTPRKINRVAEALRALLAQASDDEPALFARYLLARVAHVHQTTPPAEVEAAYRALLDTAPHVVAQLAATRLAPLLIYEREDLTPTEGLAAAAALIPRADRPDLPELSVAFYRVLAGGALYHRLADERTLAWLRRAAEIGSTDPLTATTVHVQIAELARAQGDEALAAHHYRRFLATAVPTDQRYRLVRERLAELAPPQEPRP